MEELIFGGAYKRRETLVSKSARFIFGGKFASQNRLGYLMVGRKIYVSNLQKGFTDSP